MKTIKLLSIAVMTVSLFSCNKNGVTNMPLNTQVDSVSYAIGLNMANGLKDNIKRSNFEEANIDLLRQGFVSGLDSTNILIEADKLQMVISDYFTNKQKEDQKKKQEEALKKAEEEFNDVKVAGENFLEENKTKKGVQTTASGLQYIVLKEGTGDKPESTSKVKVHYHGTTINGEVFDSSVEKDKPFSFSLQGGVIQGWLEGVKLMSVGSKYKFFIPQELAYGAFPRQGGKIKPFDALIFEIELLEIVK